MAKPSGFMDYKRKEVPHRPVEERLGDYFEMDLPLSEEQIKEQAARCMDCGIPFCHGTGCPVGNRIPEFNDLLYRGRWKEACDNLHATNNFPEVTGRVCPALCEASCTLGINDEPVLIRHIEYQVVERGFAEGWIKPLPPKTKSGKKVAVVGSGPAGLACAQQLARAGHDVTVFEKDEKIGGLLRFGIPDFKLDKNILDRRMEQMAAEGVTFETGVKVGEDISARYLQQMFDAVCITMGAGKPRNLEVEGRELENVHYAMEYLTQQNRINQGLLDPKTPGLISATDKVVVVIGGGDTGSDCVGTSRRQGAKDVYQFEIMPEPPKDRPAETPWPQWPRVLRTSTSHEEGCTRRWCILTKKLSGKDGRVTQLTGCEIEWKNENGQFKPQEIAGTEFTVDVDLVLLAMGFVHVVHEGLIEQMHLELDKRGNVIVDANFMTTVPGVFAAGDAHSGASLVVHAIDRGRKAAANIDEYLQKKA